MKFVNREAQFLGRREIREVDKSTNKPTGVTTYVYIDKKEGNVTVEGTPIDADNLNKGNWRDDDSLSFKMMNPGELPGAKATETQIVTDAEGRTWIIPPFGHGDAKDITESVETSVKVGGVRKDIDFVSDPQTQIDGKADIIHAWRHNIGGDDPMVLGNGSIAGLSENNYTTAEKNKLAGIATEQRVYFATDNSLATGQTSAAVETKFSSMYPSVPTSKRMTGCIFVNVDGTVGYQYSGSAWSACTMHVVQATGTATNKIMSQKAVTDALGLKLDKNLGTANANKAIITDASGNVTTVNKANPLPVFSHMFFTHTPNDAGWKLSDGSWVTKAMYPEAYDYLVSQNNLATAETLNIPGYATPITVHKAPNGMRFQRSSLNTQHLGAYNATGMAWFFVLDTTGQRYILPRNDRMFRGAPVSEIGKQALDGIPNIVGTMQNRGLKPRTSGASQSTGALASTQEWASNGNNATEATNVSSAVINFDASRSYDGYGRDTEVMPKAVMGNLYFFLGNSQALAPSANLEAIVQNLVLRLSEAKRWKTLWENTADTGLGTNGDVLTLSEALNVGDIIRVHVRADGARSSVQGQIWSGTRFFGAKFYHEVAATGGLDYECFYGIDAAAGAAAVGVRTWRKLVSGTAMTLLTAQMHRVYKIEKEVPI